MAELVAVSFSLVLVLDQDPNFPASHFLMVLPLPLLAQISLDLQHRWDIDAFVYIGGAY
jgi:hypothetical protein